MQDIYSTITDRLISLLEAGTVPWKSHCLAKVGLPKNFATGKAYQGINVFLLASPRYTSPWFLTYNQAQELGGQVRKGERGAMVIKYGVYPQAEENGEDEKKRTYLKAYTVFHSTQIDEIDFPQISFEPIEESTACASARAIVKAMPNPPQIKQGAATAHYRPSSDSVHMPEIVYFAHEEAYYATLFHELAHSTGHQGRLARESLLKNKGIDATGEARKIYAEEELVAEMAASFLCAQSGIIESEIENSASYLSGWIRALRTNDARSWIIRAAAQAQKAANYISPSNLD